MDEPKSEQEPNSTVVMEYNPKTQGFGWKINGNIPIPLLIGAIEFFKSLLLEQQKMQQQSQNKIVLANGPVNRMRGV